MKLREILQQLETIYAGPIGAEFAHMSESRERLWLQDRFQSGRLVGRFAAAEKRNILWQVTAAEGLERYLHTKYIGQKRFSLEGGETLLPLLDDLIQSCGGAKVEEVVIGMAHRGRLNVLVNLLGKSPATLFSEFEGAYDLSHLKGSGDVKYHKGFSADLRTRAGNVHTVLAFNPSHLEVVNPVVEGSVRARQERRNDAKGDRVLPLLIHGDAAFAGQGVVMETLQLSQARGFCTGGTVHVIINNQVGFTTSEPSDARSTSIAATSQDVGGADLPRQRRRSGSSRIRCAAGARVPHALPQGRGDRPRLLQAARPQRGRRARGDPAGDVQGHRQHPTARQMYADKLVARGRARAGGGGRDAGAVSRRAGQGRRRRARARHDRQQVHCRLERLLPGRLDREGRRRWTSARLRALGKRLLDFHPTGAASARRRRHGDREKMFAASCRSTGAARKPGIRITRQGWLPVRLAGQDSGAAPSSIAMPCCTIRAPAGATSRCSTSPSRSRGSTIINSVLSEEAVIGFEYGYSTTEPAGRHLGRPVRRLPNGAQVIIDQFIGSGEAKWDRYCGLVLFLPHGYEGAGPEHSSARLERYLQLCAEYNMQVCVPSTPAQMFHMLRRQMVRRSASRSSS